MSDAYIARWVEERAELVEIIDNTLGRAEAEQRDLVTAETEALEAAKTRLAEIDQQLSVAKEVMERRASQVDVSTLQARAYTRDRAEQPARVPALSDFIDSDQFRDYTFRGSSGVNTLDMRVTETRAVLNTGQTPGQELMPSTQKWMAPRMVDFPLIGSVNRVPVTSGNSIDIVRYGSPWGATGFASVAEGTQKPEATLVAESVNLPIKTHAAYVEITRQLLQDASAARAFVDDQLRTGLLYFIEGEILYVVETDTDIPQTTGGSGEDFISVVRKGMAKVQENGFRPQVLVTSPDKAAELDLHLMANTLAGAVAGVSPWGLTVVPVVGATKSYVGDFRRGVGLFERTGVEVLVTDSGVSAGGKDRFTNNLFAVLAEARASAAVVQPHALTEIVLTP